MTRAWLLVCALLWLGACSDGTGEPGNPVDDASGNSSGDGDGDGDSDSDGAAGDGSDGPNGFSREESGLIGEAPDFLAPRDDGWLSLIQADWELPAGAEGYRCARVTIPEDIVLGAVKPLSPLGTHHTVVTVNEEPDGPDGITECTAFVLGDVQLSASGVGTEAVRYPDGVGVQLRAGQQLLLNLHLFNFDTEPLTGTSGVLVQTLEPDEVEHWANQTLAGPIDLEIPPGRVVQEGRCTFQEATTIFGLMPHMHQLGVHMKVTAVRAEDDDVVLWDGPYDFDEQAYRTIDPVELAAGDRVDLECTYENHTDETVVWGDSTLQEMCFALMMRYPETEVAFCTD